ncbi:thioredoxin family protein [Rubrivirga sp.]|uniref:thioredoxin family protein n=1 Tax=Rubrivirga sp. TaxID=1885344 RepID=UPI003C77533A
MTRLLLSLALLLVALPASAQRTASEVPDDAPEWLPMGTAISNTQDDGKLLLVYGYASWCGFCIRFDDEVFTDDAVQEYLAEHFAVTRLNIEDTTQVAFHDANVTGAELGRAMAISGTPTNVFVDADGGLITKFPGYTDPETFLYALQYVREEVYETTPFDAYLTARQTGLDLQPEVDDLIAPRQ